MSELCALGKFKCISKFDIAAGEAGDSVDERSE